MFKSSNDLKPQVDTLHGYNLYLNAVYFKDKLICHEMKISLFTRKLERVFVIKIVVGNRSSIKLSKFTFDIKKSDFSHRVRWMLATLLVYSGPPCSLFRPVDIDRMKLEQHLWHQWCTRPFLIARPLLKLVRQRHSVSYACLNIKHYIGLYMKVLLNLFTITFNWNDILDTALLLIKLRQRLSYPDKYVNRDACDIRTM